MAVYKNIASQKIAVYAFDSTAAATPKTGDAANITAQISKDGAASAATNDINPTELDAVDHPGIYIFDLTQAETNADMVMISAASVTANIAIDPIQILTLPGDNAALDSNVTQVGSDAQSATDLKDFADAGYDPATNKVQGVLLVDTTTTLTGHTAQTGDNFARLGAPAGASVSADVAAVKGDTAAILIDTADMQPKLGVPAADVSADIATVKAETALIVADTNELQTDWTNGGRLDLLIDAIKVITDALGATAAANLAKSAGSSGIISFTAATGTLSTTQATTDLTEATTDHYKGRVIIWTSGPLAGQATDITAYNGTGGLLTFTGLTEAPSNGTTGIIV